MPKKAKKVDMLAREGLNDAYMSSTNYPQIIHNNIYSTKW